MKNYGIILTGKEMKSFNIDWGSKHEHSGDVGKENCLNK